MATDPLELKLRRLTTIEETVKIPMHALIPCEFIPKWCDESEVDEFEVDKFEEGSRTPKSHRQTRTLMQSLRVRLGLVAIEC